MDDREERKNRHRDMALMAPELTIVSDLPLAPDEAFRDTFELDFRLGPIYDILRHPKTRTPMAIAIYGDWGSGKTSAMRWLDDKLAIWNGDGDMEGKVRVKTVWFYPWKYHSKEDVWRGLISEVIIKTIDVERATNATVTDAAKQFAGFLGRSFVQVLANIKLKVKEGPVEGELSLSAIKQILDEYREAAHPEKAFLNEFEETLRSWLSRMLGDSQRMVIFIDDLDRCLPEVALEVLEALKLYLNIEKLLFVVGIDRIVVDQLVCEHYKKLGLAPEKGSKYLAKMFQAEVPVEPSERQMAAYLRDQLADVELWTRSLTDDDRQIFEGIILRRAESNPREVKRLINTALMFGAGAIMGSDHADQDARMEFRQGLQIFFVREILDKRHGRARLQTQDMGQRFFAAWSGIVCGNPKAPRTLSVAASRGSEKGEMPSEFPDMARAGSPEAVSETPQEYREILTDSSFRSLLYLLQDSDLGELMRIPYPKAETLVARMAQPIQPEGFVRELRANIVRLPGGKFTMGGEEFDDEKPVQEVTLSAFEISATPVTQAQYEAVMRDNPSHFIDPDSPVECVSWEDAMAFCKKLSREEGRTYTLPSEAQWEYACRAGRTTRFCFGDNDDGLDEYGWYAKNSEGRTHPVARKKPNPWELYDMHGNVWEWCLDSWHGNYKGALTDGSAWEDPESAFRVLRGGSWSSNPIYCRSANRNPLTPGHRLHHVGFRVVRIS
jgi:formylglycine-generating enzyme required for sulfatase activity